MEEGQSGGPRSQVPGDETTAYTGTSGKAGFAPSKCLNLLLLAHGPWRCNPLLPPDTHIPHLKWTCHLLSPSPAHLLSCLTVPARKPIWSSDTLRALSPHHAPGPRQPLQALGVHKLVRAFGEDRVVGGRGAAAGHSPGSPCVLAPRPCLAFPLVPEKSRST